MAARPLAIPLPHASLVVVYESADGSGAGLLDLDLGDPVRVAADLVEDRSGFELGEHALAGAAEPGAQAVALR